MGLHLTLFLLNFSPKTVLQRVPAKWYCVQYPKCDGDHTSCAFVYIVGSMLKWDDALKYAKALVVSCNWYQFYRDDMTEDLGQNISFLAIQGTFLWVRFASSRKYNLPPPRHVAVAHLISYRDHLLDSAMQGQMGTTYELIRVGAEPCLSWSSVTSLLTGLLGLQEIASILHLSLCHANVIGEPSYIVYYSVFESTV